MNLWLTFALSWMACGLVGWFVILRFFRRFR
jgi:hypothetical protein